MIIGYAVYAKCKHRALWVMMMSSAVYAKRRHKDPYPLTSADLDSGYKR